MHVPLLDTVAFEKLFFLIAYSLYSMLNDCCLSLDVTRFLSLLLSIWLDIMR